MWLIVGLGNPDAEYEGTRHNVGFEIADLLAQRFGIRISDRKFKARIGRGRLGGVDCVLMKPQTFMNLSGECVGPAVGFWKLSTAGLIAVHDDLDLDVGRLKLKKGGGHGGHNGLRSMMEHLPDSEFVRVRVGIGRPPPRWDAADYVLSRFTKPERGEMDRVVERAADAIELMVREGLSRAMNVVNRSEERSKE